MEEVQKIRFVTANFSILQGLRWVPFNLLGLLVAIWVNTLKGARRDLGLPILLFLLCGLLYVGIDLYYKRVFGQVKQKPEEVRQGWLLSGLFAILALAAFIIDTGLTLPISTIGLVFALNLLVVFLRLDRPRKSYLFWIDPLLLILLVALSLMPLFTTFKWWELIGFRSPVYAILAVMCLIGILAGLVSHWLLMRSLPERKGASNG